MKKNVAITFLILAAHIGQAQLANSIVGLETPSLDETSGLLIYNNHIITHNDSGNAANLYEINSSTGSISKTVSIANATNTDWEDIAQDGTYIYIGDIGNNLGNRTDLKIYKIAKADFDDGDSTVNAEIIAYSYADQMDFTPSANNTNWDAEALISYGNSLLIFTKNWLDNSVNVYQIPKTGGTHIANLVSSYQINGLITGADISPDESTIFLVGYSDSEPPFAYTITEFDSADVFSEAAIKKTDNIVSLGNQVEAVAVSQTNANKHQLYLSNEKFDATLGGLDFSVPATLWLLEIDKNQLNVTTQAIAPTLYPNPIIENIKFDKTVDVVVVYDMFGKVIKQQNLTKEISIEDLNSGVYVIHLKIDETNFIRKIIKQ